MIYTIEYYTDKEGSTMTMEGFEAATPEEARATAEEFLKEFAERHRADYAHYWTGDEEPQTVQL